MLTTSPRMSLFKSTSPAFSRTSVSRKTNIVAKAAQPSTQNGKTVLESFVKPVSLTTLSSLVLTLPAYADAGKLFDFNLTLPVMAIQFLLLMVFLDKTWFTPVGEMLDKRDQVIREGLAGVASKSDEIEKLEKEADDILKKARVDAQALINKDRAESEAKNDAVVDDAKSKSDAEVGVAFANFEKEKDAALKSLELQVDALADQIIRTLVPQGVKT